MSVKEREAVDALEAGPRINGLIAERVFGVPVAHWDWPCGYSPGDGTYGAATERDTPFEWYDQPAPVYEWIYPGWDEEDRAYAKEHPIYEPVPLYSAEIEAAWRIVERLRADGWEMNLGVDLKVTEPWDCRLFLGFEHRVIAHGPTAQVAICRAALKAVGA